MRYKWVGLVAAWAILSCWLPLSRTLAIDPLSLLLLAPWHGSYMCNQGLTRLQLTLRRPAGGDESRIEADFVFSADPDNPSVPTGSFRMEGTVNRNDRTLALKHIRWLEQPADPSYKMVDLEGHFIFGDVQAMIQGHITTYGCQDFALWQFFAMPEAVR